MIEGAGVKLPFKSWDDWVGGLKMLTKGDKYGQAIRGFKGWGQYSQTLAIMNGGGAIDKSQKTILNSPQSVEAYTWWTDLFLKHKVLPPGTPQHTAADAQQLFVKRQVAIVWENATIYDLVTKDAADQLKNLAVTQPAGPKEGTPGLHFLGGSRLMLFKGKNEAVAGEWLKYLMAKDQLLGLFKTQTTYVPTRKSVASDPMFSDTEWRKAYAKAQENATYYGTNVAGALPELQAAEGARIYANIDEAVLGGQATPQAAADEAQKKFDELRAQFKK
jgi:multiple sugar transport system substrate-binding protein